MHGQAYDGTSNMSGKTKRPASRISSQYPLTLYNHCALHCLNLTVVASFEEVSVRIMIGVENRLSVISFAQPKHQKSWKMLAIQNTQPESNVAKLKDFYRTRWIEHIDTHDCIKKLHSSIVACFKSISTFLAYGCLNL